MIVSPTWETLNIYAGLRFFRVLCMKLFIQLAHVTVDVFKYTLTFYSCQPSVDGYVSGSGGGPEASVTLPR